MLYRYLLLATRHALHIYSTSTSLLVRNVPINPLQSIVDYALSSIDSNHVYVATPDGCVALWNWQDGKEVSKLYFSCPLRAIAVTLHGDPDTETIFFISSTGSEESERYHISSHSTKLNRSAKVAKVSHFYTSRFALRHLKLFQRGSVIFSASNESVAIGRLENPKASGAQSSSSHPGKAYKWKSFSFPEGLTSIDIREHVNVPPISKNKAKDTKLNPEAAYDVAIGSKGGAIFVYQDILRILQEPGSLKPRVLHWHRGAVGAAKWSLDGKALY
jgi:NET1-associated nuclear protein 1 (U3 small nucleolar RNA-associated protein 17)